MKYILVIWGSLLIGYCFGENSEKIFEDHKIDFNWKFHPGDVENGQVPELSTIQWRTLDLPHDWSIEGQYNLQNGTDWQSGFLPAGVGWYRKTIQWDASWKDKLIYILFEGIYLNSDVWINGHFLGHRPNGYIGFEYDVTQYLQKGENVIAVRVDHSKPLTGRWYTGSGIYRHVWLKVKEPVHIATDGIFFSTSETGKKKVAFQTQVTVRNKVSSNNRISIEVFLKDINGLPVASETVSSQITGTKFQKIIIKGTLVNPQVWSPGSPYLYSLTIRLKQEGRIMDEEMIKVGFRSIEFSPESGFKLNGKVTKLKGVCEHHTAGALGSAVPDDIWLSRLKQLKEMGCNAIRTSHNPFSPAFYNICDSLGLMVMNEFLDGWDHVKADHDYGLYFNEWWKKDAEAFILRDRNHPSVIIWSIGNEVEKPTREVQKQLIDLFHQFDPTRPVTQGGQDPTRGMQGDNLPSQLDIKGFNGDGEETGVYEAYHSEHPDIPVVGTEVPHTYQTRGVYRTQTHWRKRDFPAMWEIKSGGNMGVLEKRIFPIPDLSTAEVFTDEISTQFYQNGQYFPIENKALWSKNLYYQSSYDNSSVRSSARKAWQRTRDLDFVSGQFRWGSFDYLGETNDWPSRFANFGVIDICGFPKDHYFLYQSMWTEKPMVHILPHWTHPGKDGVRIPIVVYTNCDEVELFLNGKSLGIQKYNDEQLIWIVPYESGTIKAEAKNGGAIVAADVQITSGKIAKIKINSDKTEIFANRTDVVGVAVEVTDEKGVFCPYAENEIEFEVYGPAKIIGVDNGDPLDLSDYKTNVRKAFRGKVKLWIQATDHSGEIKVKASAKNLQSETIMITSIRSIGVMN